MQIRTEKAYQHRDGQVTELWPLSLKGGAE